MATLLRLSNWMLHRHRARVPRVDIQNSTSCGKVTKSIIFKICSLDGPQPETQTQTQTQTEVRTQTESKHAPHTIEENSSADVDVDVERAK